jgi:antirestriction protein ArdC
MPTKTKPVAIDKFQWLTDKFIALIEQGTNPWQKEWRTTGVGAVQNFITKEPYKGRNPWILQIDSLVRGAKPYYCGRSQGFAKGWSIRKGCKAAYVTYANVQVKEDADGNERRIPFVKWYPVFNIEDWCDDKSDHKIKDELPESLPPLNMDQQLAIAEDFLHKTKAKVVTHGSQPCYSPTLDRIAMPAWSDFTSGVAYYATLLHELTHWTGHDSRCDRDLTGGFGSIRYSQEELVAELGASFLCAELGIEGNLENHASYLASWLKGAKEDKMFLYRSMGEAQKAVEYLKSLQG